MTKKEAKWISDKETLKAHYNKFARDKDGLLIKDTKENAEGYMRVSIENSDRYVDEENEKIKQEREIDYLEEVYKAYKKYFHIEDTRRIDIILAVALSQKLEGIPIWLILVGASGDMKSVQLTSFIGLDCVYKLHNLTSKTLVNGYKDKEKYPDLAPELDNKIVIIPDMAQILKLPAVEKGELWGQLRDLYDGMAGKVSGMGSRASYDNLKVTLLAGSTPAIDGQILVHQDLGTRELIYRTKGSKLKKEVMQKCFDNEDIEKIIDLEIKNKTKEFLEKTVIPKSKRDFVDKKYLNEIMKISTYITYMRATAEFDSYTNELRNYVYPEEPTRISKQLKRLFICLISLNKDYKEKRALEILWHLAKSSAFPIRTDIFNYLLSEKIEISTHDIAKYFTIGRKTAKRELSVLWNMNLVTCRQEPINSMYSEKTYDYWIINMNNNFIKSLSVTKSSRRMTR